MKQAVTPTKPSWARRGWAARGAWTAVLAGMSLSAPVSAQVQFSEKAAAEVAFQEAATLLQSGETAAACDKFEASHQLDPAVGTVLRLADCYDRLGKTASAWATFQEAAAMAQAQGQAERVQIARERAADLQARLSYVTIALSDATRAISGVQVMLNGSAIPAGIWGTAIPVNPGEQQVEVVASGYEPWAHTVQVEAKGSGTVNVPELERGIVTEMPVGSPAASGVARLAPAVPAIGTASTPSAGSPEYGAASFDAAAVHDVDPGRTQRIFGYVGGLAGIGALAVGGYFGYRAYDLNDQSLAHCLSSEPNACTQRGKELRDEARTNGETASIIAGAGLAVVGASFVLLLTAPSSNESAMTMQLSPRVGAAGGGLQLEGVW